MERNLNNGDFEEFLKLKTDHYKLYPSDKVWKGIYQSLHTRKRWFKIGGGLLFLSALLFVNYEFNGTKIKTPPPAVVTTPGTGDPALNNSPKAVQNSIPDLLIASSVTKNVLAKKRNNRSTGAGTAYVTDIRSRPTNTQKNQIEQAPAAPVTAEQQETDTELNFLVEEATIFTSDEVVKPATAVTTASERTPHDGTEINWLQEMAAIKLSSAKRNRFNLQLYFSPTISYRKLTDGQKSKDLSNVPLATNKLGVNDFVDHKPAIGLELGSNVLFSASKKLTLKTGLQLNYSRYSIKAYKFFFEKADIALLTAGRVSDTMSSYTSLRNFNGYSPEQLENQYVQLSLPIGAELKVLGSKKRLQLNIAGTIQPTYLLYNDTYLLSTDFINYTKEPSLVRKWNLHTSAEAFVSYYIGGMRWQVGPQFRYQTLSSYNDRYPIKEYLMEYGVKFGVSKTLR